MFIFTECAFLCIVLFNEIQIPIHVEFACKLFLNAGVEPDQLDIDTYSTYWKHSAGLLYFHTCVYSKPINY